MDFPRARLLVFAKAPVPGRAKTRLIPSYGARGAARIQRHLLWRTLAIARGAGLCPVELWCAPTPAHGFFHVCRRMFDVPLRRQARGNLGRRMHHALSRSLQTHDAAVLIGADCLTLDATQLRNALAALTAGQDAVLGPVRDGGYWLIGLRRPRAELFRGIRWSTPEVAAATRRRLRRAGLRWAELPPGVDVDRFGDLRGGPARAARILHPADLS
ncbi:MAG: TIGR04282 family arsenosugar biosynthesis glycosyltransferase [Candidatus Competibacterales bacterium]|nr:TIGR04282 family arsenosugar biosynthesis glycosyltransferase [Candidatus Competibacterales bacterium]